MAVESRKVLTRGEIGAYGLRLENVESARPLLVSAPGAWPRLRVDRKIGTSEAEYDSLTEEVALLKLQSGGEISIDRRRAKATFKLPHRMRTAELVHPLLAPAAAVMAYWLGRESFHASGFVVEGRVWALLGERGSGKSTTVARLALDGFRIVSDDLLVVEDSTVFAGPRSIDLRREAAEQLAVGEALGVVGARERWRFRLGPIPSSLELAGWIFLTWGERVQASAVAPAERLARLHANRGVSVQARDPAALLDLAALPSWEVSRPAGWASLPHAVECLLDTVG